MFLLCVVFCLVYDVVSSEASSRSASYCPSGEYSLLQKDQHTDAKVYLHAADDPEKAKWAAKVEAETGKIYLHGSCLVLAVLIGAAVYNCISPEQPDAERFGIQHSKHISSTPKRCTKLLKQETIEEFGEEIDVAEEESQQCDYVLVFPSAFGENTPSAGASFASGSAREDLRQDRDNRRRGSMVTQIFTGNANRAVPGLTWAKEAFLSSGRHHYASLEDLEERFDEEMSFLAYNQAVQSLLEELFESPTFGVGVESFPSIGGTGILWRLWLPSHVVKQYAAHCGYRMPLNDAAYEKENIHQQVPRNDEGYNVYARLPYSCEHEDMFADFAQVDRVKLFRSRLDSYIDLEALIGQRVIIQHFVSHDLDDTAQLLDTWANISHWHRFTNHMRIDEVRNYFGDPAGWMFLWQRFYMSWLVVPAIIGGIAFFRYAVLPQWVHPYVKITVAIVMSIWAALFNVVYLRHEARTNQRWGTEESVVYIHHGHDEQDEESWRPFIAVVTGDILMIGMVVISVLGIAMIQRLHDVKLDPSNSHRQALVEKAIPLLTSAQVLILDVVWMKLSQHLVRWENHKLYSAQQNAWVYKVVIIRIFNNLYPFIFVGLVKPIFYPDSCPAPLTEGDRKVDGCLTEMETQLFVTFFLRLVGDMARNIAYCLSTRAQLFFEHLGRHGASKHMHLQVQSKLLKFDDAFLMDDWTRQVTTFLFLVCFNVAMPVISVIVLLTTMIEARFTAYKYCVCFQRPLPVGTRGIGAWVDVLKLIEHIAVQVNICFVIFVLDPVRDYSYQQKLAVFVCTENAIVLLKLMFSSKFPRVPRDVQNASESNHAMVNRRFLAVHAEPIDVQPS